MMQSFWNLLGWMWRRKLFFVVTIGFSLLLMLWRFPFNDLSDALTSFVAQATGNQVYVVASELNVHLFPQPSISAEDLRVETRLPAIEAKSARVTPSLLSMMANLGTLMKAAGGNAEAAKSLSSHLGVTVEASGIWNGDAQLKVGAGKKSEGGRERTRVSFNADNIELRDIQQWAELGVKMQGRASVSTDLQMSPDLQDQPDGDFDLRLKKFQIPAGVVMIPMGEASMPMNIPTLTLASVVLRGKMNNGTLNIEEGTFGQNQDPLFGRIRGQLGFRLQPNGNQVTPVFGAYNLTVELNTNAMVQKELGIAFLPLDNAKEASAGGGAKYLFKASGQGVGMAYVPSITHISAF